MNTFLLMDGTAINLSQIVYWHDFPSIDPNVEATVMIYFGNGDARVDLSGDKRDNFVAWMHGNHPEEGFRVVEIQHTDL